MRIYGCILILTVASLTAAAGTVTMSGLGNGQGWNDGSYYTGYLTLGLDGAVYRGLCIDALDVATGNSWNALYIPLTDTAAITGAMSAYFGIDDPAVYLSKLAADMAGYAMLSGIGTDEAANNEIQHTVWAQFDPGGYTDTGILSTYTNEHPPIDLTQFGLIVDARYANGGRLEQAMLIDPGPPALQHFFRDDSPAPTPEPAPVLMTGAALLGIGVLLRKAAAAPGRRTRGTTKRLVPR